MFTRAPLDHDLVLSASLDAAMAGSVLGRVCRPAKNSSPGLRATIIHLTTGKVTVCESPFSKEMENKILNQSESLGRSYRERLEHVKQVLRQDRKITLLWTYCQQILLRQSEISTMAERKIRRKIVRKEVQLRWTDIDSMLKLLDGLVRSGPVGSNNTTADINSTKQSDTVHRMAPRNVHIEKLEELIIVAAPNDKLVHNNPSYRSKPAGNSNSETYFQQSLNNNYPIQATETDGGSLVLGMESSCYRPAIGPYASLVPSTMRETTYKERYPSATVLTLSPPRHSDYVNFETRLESFNRSTWSVSEKPDKRFFAGQGFFYTGRADLVRCFQCGVGFKDWSRDDDVIREHIKHSSACPFLKYKIGSLEVDRLKKEIDQAEGISSPVSPPQPTVPAKAPSDAKLPYKIRSPQYKTMESRLVTFRTFPGRIGIAHQQLAVAGLFFTGTGDLCRCFTCDGGLKDWSTGDDPIREHATHFPNCQYINQLKGAAYIEGLQRSRNSQTRTGSGSSQVRKQQQQQRQPTQASTDMTMDRLTITPSSLTAAVVGSAAEMGFSIAEIDVISARAELERKGEKSPSVESIINTILDMKDRHGESETGGATGGGQLDSQLDSQTDLDTILEENRQLKEVLRCMLCVTEEPDILFIPCKHHRLCHACADTVTQCPVCDRNITEKIKTYRA